MKNYEVINFVEKFNELKALGGVLGFVKPMVKNFKLAQEHLEAMESMHSESDEYKTFLLEKESLIKQYSAKDDNGNFITVDVPVGNKMFKEYSITNKEEYEAKFNELRDKYMDVVLAHVEKESNYNDELQRDCNIPFVKINEEDLPKLTVGQLMMIDEFIEYK